MLWHDLTEGLLFPTGLPSFASPTQYGLVVREATPLGVDGMWVKHPNITPQTPRARVLFLGAMTHGMRFHLNKAALLARAGFEVLLWTPACATPGQLMSLGALTAAAAHVLEAIEALEATYNGEASTDLTPILLYGEGVGAYAWGAALAQHPTQGSSIKGFVALGLWPSLDAWARARYGVLLGALVSRGFPPYASPTTWVAHLPCPVHVVSTLDDGATLSAWCEAGLAQMFLTRLPAKTDEALLQSSEVVVKHLLACLEAKEQSECSRPSASPRPI